MHFVPITALLLVFFAIALRKICRIPLAIWQIVGLGALVVLCTHQLTFKQTIHAIDFEVLLYLLGMFIIARTLEISGYLESLSLKLLRHIKHGQHLLATIIFCFGLGSALLMNDTVAIIGAQIVLILTERHHDLRTPLLLGLAFSVTIGSTLSPIGNPQNLFIALNSNMSHPISTFFYHLVIPTLLNLGILYAVLHFRYKKQLSCSIHIPQPAQSHGPKLALWPKIAFILRTIDWPTLMFFLASFILIGAVWQTGVFQNSMHHFHAPLDSLWMILIISVLLSQIISNVPLVILYLPLLHHLHAGTMPFLALAVGSTMAGNVLYTGAASNIIIIQNVEKRKKTAFGFLEFATLGVPLTLLNLAVYWLFLKL